MAVLGLRGTFSDGAFVKLSPEIRNDLPGSGSVSSGIGLVRGLTRVACPIIR